MKSLSTDKAPALHFVPLLLSVRRVMKRASRPPQKPLMCNYQRNRNVPWRIPYYWSSVPQYLRKDARRRINPAALIIRPLSLIFSMAPEAIQRFHTCFSLRSSSGSFSKSLIFRFISSCLYYQTRRSQGNFSWKKVWADFLNLPASAFPEDRSWRAGCDNQFIGCLSLSVLISYPRRISAAGCQLHLVCIDPHNHQSTVTRLMR